MAKPIQLTLWPKEWWHNPDLWRMRQLVSSVSRPTEDAALDKLYYESRAHRRRDFLPQLSWLERRVYNLDLHARNTRPHYHTEHERAVWIADQLRGQVTGAFQIKAILDDVSHVARETERLQVAIEKRQRLRAAKESLLEVAAEQFALQAA